MESILSRIRQAFSPRKETREVVCDESGFTLAERGEIVGRVDWSDVLEVFAYKEDLGHFDTICVGFRTRDEGTLCLVSEDFIGYKELVAELERRFSGIRADWFAQVAFPAFAPNKTVLWEKR